MRVTPNNATVHYSSRRLWPVSAEVKSGITIEIGSQLQPQEVGELDHFLTARWRLYTMLGRGLGFRKVEHQPWPLMRGRVLELQENLVAAAGLPQPEGAPLIHYSPGVSARIEAPALLR